MTDRENPEIPPRDAATQFNHHRQGEVSDATVASQKTPIRLFTDWLEANDKQLHQLTGMDLQTFYTHLKTDRGIERTTRANYMTAIRVFLRWLEQLDAAPSGISEKVHQPSLDKGEAVRDETIDPERVQDIVDWHRQFKYASRDHVIIELLWHTGIRLGSLRSIDIQDVQTLDGQPVLSLKHRPDQDTPLKNKREGERPINLRDEVAEAVQAYIDHRRVDVSDEYGRDPLLTTGCGRMSKSTMRRTCYYTTCPSVTGIGECSCPATRRFDTADECSESVTPHVIRRASITYWRSRDVPPEVVSDRMNVSRDILDEHYDKRSKDGKALQRRKYLDSI